jgi:ribonuclease T1
MDCVASAALFASRSRLERARGSVCSHLRQGAAALTRRVLGALLGVVFVAGVAGVLAPAAVARSWNDAAVGTIRAADLPPQGRTVLAAIRAGGPFAFSRDGITFANREGVLPRQKRGYYAEYTVPTPGVRTRGARRIIAGKGSTGDVRTSGEYYYTDDHYESFRRILQ